jgi:hypothetical protein
LFAQCGGQGYTGRTICRTGSCCVLSDFFSQCLEQCPFVWKTSPTPADTDDAQKGKIEFRGAKPLIFEKLENARYLILIKMSIVQLFAQCGGQGYTGGTKCRTGSCCFLGDYFSQCLEQCPEVAQQYRQIQSDDNQDGYIHLSFFFTFRRILFVLLKNNKKKKSHPKQQRNGSIAMTL